MLRSCRSVQYAYNSKKLLTQTIQKRNEKLAIVVHVIEIWSFYFTRKQNHCKTIALLVKHFVRGLLKLPFDQDIASKTLLQITIFSLFVCLFYSSA